MGAGLLKKILIVYGTAGLGAILGATALGDVALMALVAIPVGFGFLYAVGFAFVVRPVDFVGSDPSAPSFPARLRSQRWKGAYLIFLATFALVVFFFRMTSTPP